MPEVPGLSMLSWMMLLIILSGLSVFFLSRSTSMRISFITTKMIEMAKVVDPVHVRELKKMSRNSYVLYLYLPLFIGYLVPAVLCYFFYPVHPTYLFFVSCQFTVLLFLMVTGVLEGKKAVREIEPD